ncbi:hypothetical protein ACWEPN_33860 [Nonomuraea wenchangensis]
MLATTAKQSRCENGRGGSGDQHELPSRQDVERADVPERHSPERRAILALRDLEGVPDSPRVAAGARALVQETRLLLLDEPTSHLDLLHLVRGLGVATPAVLHDLNQAAAFCDRLYVMDGGRVVAGGPPRQVLTPELIAQAYGVRAVRRTQLVFERL